MSNSELRYDIDNAIDSYEFGIRFSLKKALGIIFHEERHQNKFLPLTIDKLVDNIFGTTERIGPEDEQWPQYDEKVVDPIIKEIRIALGKSANPCYP